MALSWMIEAEGLVKDFDSFRAVNQVSLHVPAGEILVLLGPNGAGKTTTVRMLTSILRPSAGWARIAGFDVIHQADRVRANVGVLTEHHGLYVRMNATEYLTFFSRLYGLPSNLAKKRIMGLIDQFGLSGAGKKRLGEYSKGMRQKLALVRTLLHDPPVILLDEPTSAMDPESAYIVRSAIQQLKNKDRAIILCTHNLKEAEELADQIAIIKNGKIILDGNLNEVRHRLIGSHEYELVVAKPVLDWGNIPIDGIKLIQTGEYYLRYSTEHPEVDNPQVIDIIRKKRIPIVSLSGIQHSLEDIYLQTVSQDSPQ
jgi:ABC-2 type transport system ATP-binding protein